MSKRKYDIDVGSNYLNVLGNIERTASKSGRDSSDIVLIGVTKRIGIERIKPAIDAGLSVLGEVVGTELKSKLPRILEYNSSLEIQVVGELQSNKVKFAVENCHLIQSVKSEKILTLINKYAEKKKSIHPILLQVDFSSAKHPKGLSEEEVILFLSSISNFSAVDVKGIMTIAPLEYMNSNNLTRKFYAKTYSIFQERISPLLKLEAPILSMGMTNNYELAIEEGSTMIRLGTAIFGPRM